MTEVETKTVAPVGAQKTTFGEVLRRDEQAADAFVKSHRWIVTGAIVFAGALLVSGIVLLLKG